MCFASGWDGVQQMCIVLGGEASWLVASLKTKQTWGMIAASCWTFLRSSAVWMLKLVLNWQHYMLFKKNSCGHLMSLLCYSYLYFGNQFIRPIYIKRFCCCCCYVWLFIFLQLNLCFYHHLFCSPILQSLIYTYIYSSPSLIYFQ